MSVIAFMFGFATLATQDLTENQRDARCAVALQAMTEKASDEKLVSALTGIMLFYVGRLSARNEAGKIESILDAGGSGVDPADYQTIAGECAKQMKTLTGAS